MNLLTIGDVARMANVQTSAIRYYERIGLLPCPARASGQRRYTPDILRKMGLIQMARAAGMGIADIHALLHEFPDGTPPSERWQVLATAKIEELDALIQRAQDMKQMLEHTLDCACPTLDDCGETYIGTP